MSTSVAMPRKSSLYADTWRRFARDRLAIGGLMVLLTLGLAAGTAPWLARFAPNQVDLRKLDAAPSRAHWFGTDDLGRDEFSRALYAGRVSLSIGVLSAVVAAVIGTTVGSSAGYYGGGVDSVLMRATDVVLSIPPLPLVIVLSAIT
ncbi:MAG TPA: peptide ABC transporter permease, partial [bacterium]